MVTELRQVCQEVDLGSLTKLLPLPRPHRMPLPTLVGTPTSTSATIMTPRTTASTHFVLPFFILEVWCFVLVLILFFCLIFPLRTFVG